MALRGTIAASCVERMKYPFVWLSRIHRCLGFGIQSPTDYQFVRGVVNEHTPYYIYSEVGQGDDWLRQRLGRLYFRLSNWRQPQTIFSRNYQEYLQAGCRKARMAEQPDQAAQLAIIGTEADLRALLPLCTDGTVLVIDRLFCHRPLWQLLLNEPRPMLTYDLYYCGIAIFDSKRTTQHYLVNF